MRRARALTQRALRRSPPFPGQELIEILDIAIVDAAKNVGEVTMGAEPNGASLVSSSGRVRTSRRFRCESRSIALDSRMN